jgi:hypothetical protein
MDRSLSSRVLEVAGELARLASKQSSDLKPGEIGEALERLAVIRAEVKASESGGSVDSGGNE